MNVVTPPPRQRKPPKVRKPRRPKKPKTPRRPRVKRRKPVRLKRPLSTSQSLYSDRIRTTNGVQDMAVSDRIRYSSYAQSDYVNGDRKNPNSHFYESLRVTGLSGVLSARFSPGDLKTFTGPLGGLVSPPSFMLNSTYLRNLKQLDDTQRKASEKFYKALRDSDLNLAVDIAEWKQASSMIADTGLKIRELAMRCKRFSNFVWYVQKLVFTKYGNDWRHPEMRRLRKLIPRYHRSRFTSPQQTFASTWLSYQYGWRPLMSTLYGLVELQRNRAKTMRIKATSAKKDTRYTVDSWNGIVLTSTIHNSSRSQIVCDVMVDSTILNDVSRLTTLNPAAIAWELVPYSFVVDWFLDIGRYLEELETALAVGVGLKFVRGYTTDVQLTTVRHVFGPGQGPVYFMEGQADHHERNVWKNRIKLTSLPYPFFPKFQVKLGAERVLSAAALLQNIFFKWGNSSQRR